MDSTIDPKTSDPQPNRRTFLRNAARGATAFYVSPSMVNLTRAEEAEIASLTGERTGESFWRQVKNQFTIKRDLILLNAANLCPAPRIVRDQMFRLASDVDSDASFQNRAKFDVLREEARRKLAAFLGASEHEIAIVRNTSEANNFIVNGLALKTGDEVVIFDQNHPTNNVAWDVRAARFGFTVKRISLNSPPSDPHEVLGIFRAALSPKTKVLAFTDVSNLTGVKLPSKELCALARERGIYTHVDGAQTFGALVVDLHNMGCDSYAASAHKWFLGPKEAGVLYVRSERIPQIWPSVVGVGWGNNVETSLHGARKFETLGQRDDAAVSAMATTVDFHNQLGSVRIQSRISELATALKEGAAKIPGARLRTSMNPELSAGVCVINFAGADHRKMYEALYSRYRVAGASVGGLRFCPHIYNTLEEIERTLAALYQVARDK